VAILAREFALFLRLVTTVSIGGIAWDAAGNIHYVSSGQELSHVIAARRRRRLNALVHWKSHSECPRRQTESASFFIS
jgi:hypothetical protein